MAATSPHVAQIIKLGGAAITEKQTLEKLNHKVLGACAQHLRVVHDGNNGAGLIVVHGAGSFGHIQASQSGVARGGIQHEGVRQGFVDTRLSVTKLNQEVVKALVEEGIPAVGVSVCGHWLTKERKVSRGPTAEIQGLVKAGIVPVLHGDAVMDETLGCTILSGDEIIRHLAEILSPDYVVFLTNVAGVFDQPPENDGAEIISEILVDNDGWRAVCGSGDIKFSTSEHDTTGGINAKLEDAAAIASMGTHVFIAEAGAENGLEACEKGPNVRSTWIGTHVKPSAMTKEGT